MTNRNFTFFCPFDFGNFLPKFNIVPVKLLFRFNGKPKFFVMVNMLHDVKV